MWEDDGTATSLDKNLRQMRFSCAASNIDALFRSPRNSHHVAKVGNHLKLKPEMQKVKQREETVVGNTSSSSKQSNTGLTGQLEVEEKNAAPSEYFKQLLAFFETDDGQSPTTETETVHQDLNDALKEKRAEKRNMSSFLKTRAAFSNGNVEVLKSHSDASSNDLPQHQMFDTEAKCKSVVSETVSGKEKSAGKPDTQSVEKGGENLAMKPSGEKEAQADSLLPTKTHVKHPETLISNSEPMTPSREIKSAASAETKNGIPPLNLKVIDPVSEIEPVPISDVQPTVMEMPEMNIMDQKQENLDEVSSPVSPRVFQGYSQVLRKFRSQKLFSPRKKQDNSIGEAIMEVTSKRSSALRTMKSIIPRLRMTELLGNAKMDVVDSSEMLDEDLAKYVAERSSPKDDGVSPILTTNVNAHLFASSATEKQTRDNEQDEERGEEITKVDVEDTETRESSRATVNIREERPEVASSPGKRVGAFLKKMKTSRSVFDKGQAGRSDGIKITPQPLNAPRKFIMTETGPHLIGEPSPWAPQHVRDGIYFEGLEVRNEDSIADLGAQRYPKKSGEREEGEWVNLAEPKQTEGTGWRFTRTISKLVSPKRRSSGNTKATGMKKDTDKGEKDAGGVVKGWKKIFSPRGVIFGHEWDENGKNESEERKDGNDGEEFDMATGLDPQIGTRKSLDMRFERSPRRGQNNREGDWWGSKGFKRVLTKVGLGAA